MFKSASRDPHTPNRVGDPNIPGYAESPLTFHPHQACHATMQQQACRRVILECACVDISKDAWAWFGVRRARDWHARVVHALLPPTSNHASTEGASHR